MLESRPIVQKSLAGAGAFMFVFVAAMAGTGVMISGGIGLPHADAQSAISDDTTSAPADWDFAETDLNRPSVVQTVNYTPPPQRLDAAPEPVAVDSSLQQPAPSPYAASAASEPATGDDTASNDTSGDDAQMDGASDDDGAAKKALTSN